MKCVGGSFGCTLLMDQNLCKDKPNMALKAILSLLQISDQENDQHRDTNSY